MYEELVKQLIEESKCPDNYSEDSILMIKAANAIDELDTLLDGVSAENESLCETIEMLKKQVFDMSSIIKDYREKIHWIPVTERLPNSEVEVLVYTKDKHIGIDKFFSMILDRPTFSKKGMNRVTYWMPKPKPPKEEESDVQCEI